MVFSGLLDRCLINDSFVIVVDDDDGGGGGEVMVVMSVEVL